MNLVPEAQEVTGGNPKYIKFGIVICYSPWKIFKGFYEYSENITYGSGIWKFNRKS